MKHTFDINKKTISLKNILYITEPHTSKNGSLTFSIVYKRPFNENKGIYDDTESQIDCSYSDEALGKEERLRLLQIWESYLSEN